ncbi:MAG TPA: hypothetical protein PK252_05680 [Bacteroidales bacterium]|nr:hypothetical protein [Bacteroidales bacterium]
MRKMNYLTMMALVAITINFTSCKKDDDTQVSITNEDVTVMQDDAQINDMMDDIDNEADEISDVAQSKSALASDSTTYSGREVDRKLNNDGTRTITITYTNFQHPKAKNERIKNGIVYIVVTGSRSDNTYKRIVTFENFTINNNKIEGTKTIEKMETLKYKITLTNGKITFTDGSSVTCNYIRYRTMVAGIATPLYIWDDAYTFEGSASGVTSKNIEYTKTITKAVKIYTAYRYPVEGTFSFTSGDKTFIFDYGDGTKDNLATITYKDVSKEITLKK